MAYLRAMSKPQFQCGLDGDFDSYPELRGWLAKAHSLAQDLKAMRSARWRVETVGPLRLPCLIELDGNQAPLRWLLVIHPLWRADFDTPRLLGATSPGVQTVPIDTFDLERRPLHALEMSKERQMAPEFQP
jgi:hypothetical protein